MTTTNHRLRAALLACGLLAGCGPADPDSAVDAAPAAAATSAVDAPMQPKAAPAMPARVIAGRYIVTFSAAVADPAAEARDLVARAGGTLHFTYGRALRGFAASLPDAGVAALRGNPRIASVEADQVVSIGAAVQNWATWGLDRVDQRALPLDKDYRFGASGAGVTAFVIDTGIRPTHAEFRDGTDSSFLRVLPGYSAIADDNGTRDCHGHGTHVAGTIGGLSYGVAKQVMLVPVRVLDCTGSGAWSGVIAGLDHVARSSARPAVANLSLGGGASSSLDTAIANTVAAGVTVVVAAGNSNADACTMSPARAPSAITVGASTREDARAPYSNYGPCLDLFAPGSDIASSLADGDTAVGIASGTSMAAPHVAGAAALVLQDAPSLAPGAVWDRLKALATPDRVASAGTGSPNRLLYTNPDAEPAPPPGTMSVAALTGSATVNNSANWRATVAIDVRDGSGRALANVRVTGGFTVGGDPLACTTAANGRCSVTSASLSRKSVSATRFAVSSLSGAGLLYDPAANAAGSITVLRP